MPTFKKYKPFLACEDYNQRCTSHSSSSIMFETSHFFSTDNIEQKGLQTSTTYSPTINRTLMAGIIKASADSYDINDYNGTSTGSCTFAMSQSVNGTSYQVAFTASESTTIKCFKFFKELSAYNTGGTNQIKTFLMFAIYFDEPIAVTSGQTYNMSINFAYDDNQVVII